MVYRSEIRKRRSRLATTHEARIQATSSDGMLLAYPGNEALKTQSIPTVRRGTVSNID
jgi:hypothetical protein